MKVDSLSKAYMMQGINYMFLQVQPQAQSDVFLPAIKNNESSLKKQGTGHYPSGSRKGGIRSLQHQPSDRFAESKRDANMVAYAAKWQ